MTSRGLRSLAASLNRRKTRRNFGSALATSSAPIIATSRASTRVSTPACLISSPPAPKNSNRIRGSSARSAETSFAPCLSPEASPATIIKGRGGDKEKGGQGEGETKSPCLLVFLSLCHLVYLSSSLSILH